MTEPTVHRIVAAALGLVDTHGLSGVTMSAIAEQADVARQTLYNHFPDLDSIIGAVLEQHADEAISAVARALAEAATYPAKLRVLVTHHVTVVAHGRDVEMLAAGLAPAIQRQIGEHFEAYRAVIEALVREGVAAGSYRQDLNPAPVSIAIHRLLEAGTDIAKRSGAATAEALIWDLVSRAILETEDR